MFLSLFWVLVFVVLSDWGGGVLSFWILLLFLNKDSVSLVMIFLLPIVWVFFFVTMKKSSIEVGKLVFSVMYMSVFLFFFVSSFFLFFFFFELSMFPILFFIAGWGYQVERFQASNYFLFYAFFCSLPFLAGLLLWLGKSFSSGFFSSFSGWGWGSWFLFLPFLAKLPVFVFHLWLPKAHVEAPTSGSMVLAAVLLKMGGYGLFRVFSIVKVGFFWGCFWGLVGGVVSSVICGLQSDAKSLVAYSSVSHMNFMVGGLFVLMTSSKSLSLLIMLSHGFVSAVMFFYVGLFFYIFFSRCVFFMSGSSRGTVVGGVLFFSLLLGNFSVPFFLSSFGEIYLFIYLFSKMVFVGGFLFFYCLMICYSSVFFFLSLFFGKSGQKVFVSDSLIWNKGGLFFLMLSLNLFFLMLV